MRRTTTYNEDVSRRLKNPKFAQEFIYALMEGADALAPEDALRHTIEVMGVKEFSRLCKIPPSNIVPFLKRRQKLKPETLDKLLKPFKLKARLIFERAV